MTVKPPFHEFTLISEKFLKKIIRKCIKRFLSTTNSVYLAPSENVITPIPEQYPLLKAPSYLVPSEARSVFYSIYNFRIIGRNMSSDIILPVNSKWPIPCF